MFYRENVIKTIFLGLYFCFIKLTTLKTFKSIFCTTRSRSRHFFVGSAPQHWQSDTERGQESLESLDESNTNIPKFDQKIYEKFDKKSHQKFDQKIHQKVDNKKSQKKSTKSLIKNQSSQKSWQLEITHTPSSRKTAEKDLKRKKYTKKITVFFSLEINRFLAKYLSLRIHDNLLNKQKNV